MSIPTPRLLGSFLYWQFLCQQAFGWKAFLSGSCQGLWRAVTALKETHDPQNYPARQEEASKDPVTTNKGSDSAAWAWQGTHTILGPELHSPLTTLLHWSILKSISSYGGIRGHLSVSSNRPWALGEDLHCTHHGGDLACHSTTNKSWLWGHIVLTSHPSKASRGLNELPSISCSAQRPWRYLGPRKGARENTTAQDCDTWAS